MNCQIRQWNIEDAQDLAIALSNPHVQKNLRDGLPYPYTKQDAIEYIQATLSADPYTTFSFAIVVDEHVVGSIGIFRQDNIHSHTAELGYYLNENYWGQGIMSEAVRQATQYIFSYTDIIRIFAEPFSHNVGSCRVLEKTGFHFEGLLEKNAIKDGQVYDMKMYALIKAGI
jgi:ribosomal-protein-alanine N-acetyltransferase